MFNTIIFQYFDFKHIGGEVEREIVIVEFEKT